jgi:hypothetical protein
MPFIMSDGIKNLWERLSFLLLFVFYERKKKSSKIRHFCPFLHEKLEGLKTNKTVSNVNNNAWRLSFLLLFCFLSRKKEVPMGLNALNRPK